MSEPATHSNTPDGPSGPPLPTVHSSQGETEVGSVFVSNYPPFSAWSESEIDAYHRALDTPVAEDVPLGLYLHIPFCRKRCKFCYFRVFTDKNAGEIQRYLDALAREVELYAEKAAVRGRPLQFIYFGGGTPSYVAVKHLEVLVERLQAAKPWGSAEEITFECEPGTLTESKVAAYREMGVTRLSLGIENWNDDILAENGRAHLTAEIHRALPWIRGQGFDQLNVDLIAGMVGETWDTWKDTVARTIEIEPDSVTVYQMELPYNTVYSKGVLHEGQPVPVADWETKRDWNRYAIEELEKVGYELSSAYTMVKRDSRRPGAGRFVYRDALWHGLDMLGTGIASFGHLQGIHAQNHAGWGPYLEALEMGELPVGRALQVEPGERLTRELILQTKLGQLDLDYFRRKFGVDPQERYGDVFRSLDDRGFLAANEDDRVELTRDGLLRVDSLLPAFYDERYRDARYT